MRRFQHIGIPTTQRRPDEQHLPQFGMYVSGFGGSLYGVEAASHVHQEERVLSGDMESLVAEWRNAEELAEVSDRLIEPPGWAEFEAEHGDPTSGEDAV